MRKIGAMRLALRFSSLTSPQCKFVVPTLQQPKNTCVTARRSTIFLRCLLQTRCELQPPPGHSRSQRAAPSKASGRSAHADAGPLRLAGLAARCVSFYQKSIYLFIYLFTLQYLYL